jgi:glutathione S-transferase
MVVPGLHIPRIRWMTGQNKVPVIRLDGRILFGSGRILEELERLRPDPPLFPADPAARKRALGIQRYFDDEVAPDLRRLFWSTYLDRPADCVRLAADGAGAGVRVLLRAIFPLLRMGFRRNMGLDAETIAATRSRLGGVFDRLESEIGPHGFLVGDSFTVADLAAAAVMTAIIRPPQFPYPLPEPWPPALVELRESVAHRAGFKWVLDTYAKHRGTSAEIA